jgi:hypothetical protein
VNALVAAGAACAHDRAQAWSWLSGSTTAATNAALLPK